MSMLSKTHSFSSSSSSSSSKNPGFLGRLLSKNKSSRNRLSNNNGCCFERVFAYFDEDGDGRVSPGELRRAVASVGGEMTAEEAEMAVRLSDSDGDGELGFEDFTKLMMIMDNNGDEKNNGDGEDELREVFGMYVIGGSGFITPKSLKRMLTKLGESTTIDKCRDMIRRFDLNGDGVLSFDEFKVMMRL